MEIQDISRPVFPFGCGNPKCTRGYNLSEFSDIVMLWGFIYLTQGKYRLIGITCPKCLKTTIRKYPRHTLDLSIDVIENHPNTIGEIRSFVPFSVGILSNAGIAPCPPASTGNGSVFSFPEGLKPVITYPEYIRREFPYAIHENQIQTFLNIENEVGYKAFPRIYPENSVYQKFDHFLLDEDAEEIPGETIKGIHDAFTTIIEVETMPTLEMPTTEPRKFHPVHSKAVDSDRLMGLDLSEDTWQTDRFMSHVTDFVGEYREVRNKIDFDRTYRDKFLDKYIDLFYYIDGLKEQREVQHKIELMESESGEEMVTAPDPEYQPQDTVPPPAINVQTHETEGSTEKYEFEQLEHEKEMLENSIGAAIEIGMAVPKEGAMLHYTEVHSLLHDIEPKLPSSTIEIIWETIPSEAKNPEPFQVPCAEKTDNFIGRSTMDAKMKRKLGQLRTEKVKWDRAINAAVKIGIFVTHETRVLIRDEVKDEIFSIDPILPDTVFEKIWKAIPPKFRHTGGRPHGKKTKK